jgi:hypothetical protein
VTTITDQSTQSPEAEAPASLPFERRQVDRWPLEGVATAFELAGANFGRMHTLKMADYSHDGMGATSDSPLPLGASVSIGFQAPGYTAKRGQVSRCEPCGDGYRVGIIFEHRLAA